jgi:hydrogenase maturation protein HypF
VVHDRRRKMVSAQGEYPTVKSSAMHIHVNGIVQGVGFRPFIYGLATHMELVGWVRNSSAGVDIHLEGEKGALSSFLDSLTSDAPPLAKIHDVHFTWVSPEGFTHFEIISSQPQPGAFQPISPDISTCADCLQELFDPTDRRYLYPFINCTNCGPRLTITKDIPYDRPTTTMAQFEMCVDCKAEYNDPLNRRFHAQPIACPVCGPEVWLEISDDKSTELPAGYHPRGQLAIQETLSLLRAGSIVAIKGLGGFHLACDATNPTTVAELRRRKLRVDKPFAVMIPGSDAVTNHCYLNQSERNLLESRERPIVILKRRPESTIVTQVAPNQDTLGVMLPYTPLHALLFNQERLTGEESLQPPQVLVMTSGNLSEEPIAYDNAEALQRLSPLCDAFLLHDRPIHTRVDDSVVRIPANNSAPVNEQVEIMPLRRSRGYVPDPIDLPWKSIPILATGAELKNTFCLLRDEYAFLSHHIGDLENYETLKSFEEGIAHFEKFFRISPQVITYDLHPDYLSTRYALNRAAEEKLPAMGVQHHHAHIAACMAENGIPANTQIIGVSFDGTGYGEDGAIWGGEFLLADYSGYKRFAHLDYVPLPGGDKTIREPWRFALACLTKAALPWDEELASVRHAHRMAETNSDLLKLFTHQVQSGLNAPPTSSMGRLFDAVAALAGVRQEVNYEAQAAMELEQLVDPHERGIYSFELRSQDGNQEVLIINQSPMFSTLLRDLRQGVSATKIAARFHNGVAYMVMDVVMAMRKSVGISTVALSGGVWQNLTLLSLTCSLLQQQGFDLLLHRRVPPNDGGLSLGQAIVAAYHHQSLL